MLGNRSDIATSSPPVPSRVDGWLRDSYIEIGYTAEFSELEVTSNGQFAMPPQNQPGFDKIAYPPQARAIKSIMFYDVRDGTPYQPEIKDIQLIRQYNNKTNGPPSIVAYYGQQIYIRPLPDRTYNYVLDYWQKPQITNNNGDLGQTLINVPDDWLEIVDYGAAMRGHAELLERDKSQELMNLLFGLTIPTSGKMIPGLIQQRLTRRRATAPFMDYGMTPRSVKNSYTNTQGS